MSRCIKILKNKKGMNFIELLVSIAILGVITTVAVVVAENINHFRHINSQLDAQDSAKSALYVMSKDIRGAKNFNTANVQPTSFAFLTMDGGTISYYLDLVTNELIKETSGTAAIPLVPPITKMTLLKDVEPVNASHPKIFDYAGKMISIDIILKKSFIKNNKANMRFKTEVCVRNP